MEALQRDKIDIVVVPAALPDFRISNDKRNEKLESGLKQHIDLIPEEKLIYRIRNIFSGKIVVFSLNSETDPDKIRRKYSKADPDIIVHNSISEGDGNFGERSNNYTLIERDRVVPLGVMNKQEMTLRILREAAETS